MNLCIPNLHINVIKLSMLSSIDIDDAFVNKSTTPSSSQICSIAMYNFFEVVWKKLKRHTYHILFLIFFKIMQYRQHYLHYGIVKVHIQEIIARNIDAYIKGLEKKLGTNKLFCHYFAHARVTIWAQFLKLIFILISFSNLNYIFW